MAQVVTHATLLWLCTLRPLYAHLHPANPKFPVPACGRFIRDGQMLYLAYELPSVLDGGHILKAGCQARLLGRPWHERAGQSSWLWPVMRLRGRGMP